MRTAIPIALALAACHASEQDVLTTGSRDEGADAHYGAIPGEYRWAHGFGTAGQDLMGRVLALPDGGAVVAGYVDAFGTPIASFTVGGDPLPTTAGTTGFLARFDANGATAWSVSFSSTSPGTTSGVSDLALAPDGSIVVVGGVAGATDVAGHTLSGPGTYLVRFSPGGEYLSGRVLGAFSADDVEVAADGSIYLGGGLSPGSATVDGITLTTTKLAGLVVALDSGGTARWAHLVGGTDSMVDLDADVQGETYVNAIALDGEGVVLGGQVAGDADVGTGPLPSLGGTDGLVVALDADGHTRWARRFGGGVGDRVSSIAARPDGSVAIAGEFGEGAAIDGFPLEIGAGHYETFLAVLEGASGAARWARSLELRDRVYRVNAAPGGELLVTGHCNLLVGADAWGAFIGLYDGTGAMKIGRSYPSPGAFWDGAIGPTGDVFAVGDYHQQENITLDVGGGQLPRIGGFSDMAVAKLRF